MPDGGDAGTGRPHPWPETNGGRFDQSWSPLGPAPERCRPGSTHCCTSRTPSSATPSPMPSVTVPACCHDDSPRPPRRVPGSAVAGAVRAGPLSTRRAAGPVLFSRALGDRGLLAARWRDCPRPRSGRTPPMSSGSPSGPAGRRARSGRCRPDRAASLPGLPGHPPVRQGHHRPHGGLPPLATSTGARSGAWSTPIPRPACPLPSPDSRLPRVLGHSELDAAARARGAPPEGGQRPSEPSTAGTTPCSSCSTAAVSGWRSSAVSTSTTSTWPAGGHGTGKGAKQRQVLIHDRAPGRVRAWLDGPRAAIPRDDSPPGPCSSTGGETGSGPGTSGGSSTAGRRSRPTPTPCATASPPTCSTGAPTCGWSRNCSGTPACRPRRSTLMSARSGCFRCIREPIHGPKGTIGDATSTRRDTASTACGPSTRRPEPGRSATSSSSTTPRW